MQRRAHACACCRYGLAGTSDSMPVTGDPPLSPLHSESIPQFNPQTGMCTSNALSSVDVSDDISSRIHLAFLSQLRDSRGRPYSNNSFEGGSPPRILEKTPKNAVRVSMLNELFPDALYIYLYRNPRENISSIIDA